MTSNALTFRDQFTAFHTEIIPPNSQPTLLTQIVQQVTKNHPWTLQEEDAVVLKKRVEAITNLALHALNQLKWVIRPESYEGFGLTASMNVSDISPSKWNAAFEDIAFERASFLFAFFGYLGKVYPDAKVYLDSILPEWEPIWDLVEQKKDLNPLQENRVGSLNLLTVAADMRKWLRARARILEKITDLKLPKNFWVPPEIIYFPNLHNLSEIRDNAKKRGDTEVVKLLIVLDAVYHKKALPKSLNE